METQTLTTYGLQTDIAKEELTKRGIMFTTTFDNGNERTICFKADISTVIEIQQIIMK